MVYEVKINRQKISALFDIKGNLSDVKKLLSHFFQKIPEKANTSISKSCKTLMYIGQDNWILRGPIEEEEELNSLLKSGATRSNISVVLVSDTLTFFSVTGLGAKDIMAIASPLDFYEKKFRENSVTFSEVFGTKALIQRIENGFEFGVDQSYSDMVEDYLYKSIKL
jgi:sarcosine oxidase subunit gamma|tara:strand:- start:2951 stop:3451 length:501 start_codon:yes stop_codon:yes gene_type:complete